MITELDAEIAAQLRATRRASPLPTVRVRGRKPHDPRFDVREALNYVTGVDLTAIDGSTRSTR